MGNCYDRPVKWIVLALVKAAWVVEGMPHEQATEARGPMAAVAAAVVSATTASA